jgi:hypothetical protein
MRTLRFAADIAVTRNGQQATAGALVSRWQHEVQIAILRRRAAMARAVLPRASAQELWLLTGQTDRDINDGDRAPPLDEDGASVMAESADDAGSDSENDAEDDQEQ